MKEALSGMLVGALLGTLTGVVFAWGPGAGPGAMGRDLWIGPCPGFAAHGPNTDKAVTEDEARKAATEYVTKYFSGYTIERVRPFTGWWATMYRVELKGPKGETRVLHVNPSCASTG